VSSQDAILEELRIQTRIMVLIYGETIEKELSKIATTDERKKIWVLIDGEKTPKEIASLIGISERSVHRFLNLAIKAGLVKKTWGEPPRRLIPYVPPSWIELIKLPEEKVEKEEEQT